MAAKWSLSLLLFAWLVFGAAWSALHLLIVPRIGEFRPQLEATASRVLGVTVQIESVTAHSTGMIPAFELSNVNLLDAQGRPALRLPRILVSLSPRSLLSLKFDQLYIDRPTLDVRRAADGKIYVAGLALTQGNTDVSRNDVLDQLFSQPEFVIRHGAIVWTDELRNVPALALRDVDLVLRNHARQHELRLDATPPSDWGERFGLVARFEQPFLSMDSGRWQEWSGQAFAQFTRVDVSQLKRHADMGVDVLQGRGALRAWVDVRRGRVSAATADVALADVSVRLDPALAPLQLASLSGRLAGTLGNGTLEFSTQELAFGTAEGLQWPGGNVRFLQTAGDASRPARGELVADRLDLAALSQIAERLPLGRQMHAALTRYSPRGLVEHVKAKWQGSASGIDKFEVNGRVQQLHLQSLPAPVDPRTGAPTDIGTPGVTGATVDFVLTESTGKASVAMENGSIEFPGVFELPTVPFSRLSAELAWQLGAGGKTQVQVSNLRFSNPDADGELQLKWQTSDPARSRGGSRYPGVVDLQGTLSRADGTRVFRYLPLSVNQRARDYVRNAVQSGSVSGVRIKVKGDLRDMPFSNPKLGEFLITANIRDALFDYVPRSELGPDSLPWPSLAQLSGELVIDRNSLQIKAAQGTVTGAPGIQLTQMTGGIADLAHATVALSLEARGSLSDMLSVVNGSPLASLSGNALARASTSGNADLRFKLSVPLVATEKTSVQGSVTLSGNDFQLSADVPRLSRARGVVAFSESGFNLNALQARALGGDVRLDGGSVAAGPAGASTPGGRAPVTLSFRAQGTASAEGLRQARELGLVSRLAQHASGAVAYTAAFAVLAGFTEVSVSSNLVGLALNFPEPLGKPADTALPLRFESTLVRDAPNAAAGARRLQDQLVLDLGRVGSATYVRDLSGAEPRVVRGAIALGLAPDESAPLPSEGVVANLHFASVDVDKWSALLAQVSAPGGPIAPVAAGAVDTALRGYLPDSLAVRARELSFSGHRLRNVVLGGSREGLLWHANVDSDELNGYLEYRQASGAGAGRVFARLSRLTLAQSSTNQVEALLDAQPTSIPALDIVVGDLELRGKKMGRLEIDAVNEASTQGIGREWRLNRLELVTPDALFRATGNWSAAAVPTSPSPGARSPERTAEPRRTVMNFRLEINNSGDLLARMGMKDVIRRGKGSMEGRIAWAGSPLGLDYPSLSGAFSVNVENGQFMKADPGLAKLLGVLSLQSLPRRLALDFRDVFSEGFAFDFFRGDVKIERGVASSNNLQMKGVNAAVLMDGSADLARETHDLRVVVVPEINAGTASLIATAINPAIGLGTFLAQLFLRRPLMEAATQEFHVDGTWVDPRIRRVDRRAALAAGTENGLGSIDDKKLGDTR